MRLPLLFFLALLPCSELQAESRSSPRPNVIVIFTDDQGYADLGCHDLRQDVKTPHLDRLAREGVLFTDGYVTAPQCSPSRAALLTGRYQQRFGFDSISEGPLPLGEKTLADRLRAAGYVTGMVGKWHLEPNSACLRWAQREHPELIKDKEVKVTFAMKQKYSPRARGFDDFYWGETESYRRNFDLEGRALELEGEFHETAQDRIEEQTKAALAFVRRHAGRPFFLYLAYYAPHVPLAASKECLDRFPGDMPERRRAALAMIAAVDDGVGRIVSLLEEKGLRDNSLIVFSSDNGAPLGAHQGRPMEDVMPVDEPGPAWNGSMNTPLAGEKGMLSEGGIRVPFFLSWPARVAQDKIISQPVMTFDLTATINAAAGLPPDPAFDGIDLLPYLTKPGTDLPPRALFWRFWGQSAVRSGDWKLLRAGDEQAFLFNLKDDREERRNVIANHPDLAEELQEKLSAWAEKLDPAGLPHGSLNDQETKWYRYYFGLGESSRP